MKTTLAFISMSLATEAAGRARYKFAECALIKNPTHEFEGFLGGHIIMAQDPAGGDLWIRAEAKYMPLENFYYGMAININNWDGNDCATAGPHLNPFNSPHGLPKSSATVSHMGDLPMMQSNYNSIGSLWSKVNGPLMSGQHSILGRSITLYESFDDYGYGDTQNSGYTGNTGKPLACCTIVPLPELRFATYEFTYQPANENRRMLKTSDIVQDDNEDDEATTDAAVADKLKLLN